MRETEKQMRRKLWLRTGGMIALLIGGSALLILIGEWSNKYEENKLIKEYQRYCNEENKVLDMSKLSRREYTQDNITYVMFTCYNIETKIGDKFTPNYQIINKEEYIRITGVIDTNGRSHRINY